MSMHDEQINTGSYGHIGRRIHVIGNSCSGKSTLGAALALVLDVPLVELDALNWRRGWMGLKATDPVEFERLIAKETGGHEWIVAGSYARFSQRVFWPRLQTIIWLDLPLYQLVWRMLRRSWTRWRSRELLWGTNYEKFWPQLKIWNKEDSLLSWMVSQHWHKRRRMRTYRSMQQWQHIRFLRLKSSAEVEAFTRALTYALQARGPLKSKPPQ